MTDEEIQREREEAERLIREINATIDRINRVNQENAQLEYELEQSINNVKILIGNCGEMDKAVYEQMGFLSGKVGEADISTKHVFDAINELTTQYFTFKKISTASKNVTQFTDEYHTRFSYYNELRRISLGYVVGLDSHIISSDNARKKVEKAYLQNTEYWLAYCISAVMLWASNEPEAAQRAMSKSLSVNYFNSCLFYLLINLRFNRIEAAKKWYVNYLDRADMNDLGDEWQYLLQAYLFGAFGSDEEFQNIVAQCFQNMLGQVEVATVDFAKKFTKKAIEFAELYVHKSELEYTTLRRTCSEYSEMHSLLSTAEKNAEIAKYYDSLSNAEGTEGEDLSQRIENVLYSLVNDYDDDELKVVQKIKYNEAVINARGDIAIAQANYDAMFAEQQKKKNLGDLLLSWAFADDSSQADVSVKRFSIKKVIDSNMKASGYDEADIVGQIRQYIRRMQPSDQLEYSMLRKYCTEFDALSDIMMQAKNNISILEFILQTVNVPAEQRNTFLKGYIDELIATPNQAEKDVYDEIAYNELVIRYEGEVDLAREAFSAEQTKKANDLNLIAEMIDWIYERDVQDVNGQIRLNMFTLTKSLQEQAVDAHVEDYRGRRKVTHQVSIGEYSTEVNFKREDEEYSKVSSFFTQKRDGAVAEIKSWKSYLGFGIGAAAAIGAFFVGYWLFAVALIGIGYGVGVMISNRSQIKHLEQKCAESIKTTSDILQQLFAEFSKYQAELDEYDSYYERIKNEFSKI